MISSGLCTAHTSAGFQTCISRARVSLQSLGSGGGSGGSSEAAAAVVPRPGEVPQLADGGRDHMQRLNRRHQQGASAGAAGGQEPAGTVEGRTLTHCYIVRTPRRPTEK